MITVIAPAKVNLHLAVGSIRPDGYHDLTGVFHTLALADELILEPAGALSFDCDADLGIADESNLAHRAAVEMSRAIGRPAEVAIRLTKRIPHGAGLGGGSSDAAAIVAGLATLWGLDSTDPRCLAVARSLGADVAFFLEPGGAALMTGRGDVLARSLPALGDVPVALVRPPEPVPTGEAYAAFDSDPVAADPPDAVVAALSAGDPRALARALTNNLERASSAVVPAVAEAIAWVRAWPGVLGAAVAGSGSAVFAIVGSDQVAAGIGQAAEERGWWGCATRLGAHGVAVQPDMRGDA